MTGTGTSGRGPFVTRVRSSATAVVARLLNVAFHLPGRLGEPGVKTTARAHAALFRATKGKLGGSIAEFPVLLLVSCGRKTGQRRTTPLPYFQDGEVLVVVASWGGRPQHPGWYLNLVADPDVTVQIGDTVQAVRARTAVTAERARLWPGLCEMAPNYREYQTKTTRQIPVVMLEPR